ncbi:HNH endonuclease signature motif containing protein [Sinomonas sp. R1AF57]|uniref:HNH endonuclease signature motif containing protein n=1 Tax=Sinomonas sp. R1AF57 TaxID=2020377 RepID=UPI0035100403
MPRSHWGACDTRHPQPFVGSSRSATRAAVFPPATDHTPHTEADHTHEWSTGGSTDAENLGLLCPEHHRIKTLGHWTAEQNERDGTIVWTSPLSRRHVTRACDSNPRSTGQPPSPPRKPPPDRPPPF